MNEGPRRVAVWDAPTRLFHWALVLLVGLSWWSASADHLDWHRWSGSAILGLLLFRLAWGVFGSQTARFSDFVKGPRTVLRYAGQLRRHHPPSLGHNPLGGWSVIALLLTLITQCVLGLFSVDVDGLESGPLAGWISFDAGRRAAHAHHLAFALLQGLVGLHLLAIAVHRFFLHDDLLTPMITGTKRAQGPSPSMASGRRAVILALLAALIVLALMR